MFFSRVALNKLFEYQYSCLLARVDATESNLFRIEDCISCGTMGLRVAVLACLFAVVITSAPRRSELRQYFNCNPCDVTRCPDVSDECEEVVRENGVCGCCYVCARQQGESCGFSRGKCARGLSCMASEGSRASELQVLQRNRGVCGRRTFSKWDFRGLANIFSII